VLLATFLIDHFDLFGLKQGWRRFRGERHENPAFRVRGIYRRTRHPLYLGFLLAFWSTPHMTQGHLLFSVMTTAFMLVAVRLEERDLVRVHGDDYIEYRRQVPMLVPSLTRSYGAK
jgi:protein-S-isoprenylcysteine O-methyltransferase Ste14